MSKSAIVAIEARRVTPQPRTMRKLAAALGVKAGAGREGEEELGALMQEAMRLPEGR